MSDFFSDDFTAELKAYFLDSVCKEAEKFIDLIDESTLRRIRNEVSEQTKAWAIDAKTNEFVHFAEWLGSFSEKTQSFTEPREFIKAIKTLHAYSQALTTAEEDSAELAAKFTLSAELRRDVLFLHCRWGVQEFAVPVLNVVEISSQIPLYPLPEEKPGILGVIPYRGEAVPVINFQDHGFKSGEIKNTFYVICEQEGVRFSLQVTETDDLMSMRESDLQNIDGHEAVMQTPFAKQFFIKDGKSVMVLDLEKLVA